MPQSHSFASFRYAPHATWSWPKREEAHDLMRHPHGVILLSCFLLLQCSLAMLVFQTPSAEGADVIPKEWLNEEGSARRIDRAYRVEASQRVKEYVRARGAFAAALASGAADAEATIAWQAVARETKEQLLAMMVSDALKEVHLGLVVAVGLDEAAADLLRLSSAQEGDRTGAADAFAAAEDRVVMVLQSAPWLVQQ